MPKATQFDLALARPRPDPAPRKLRLSSLVTSQSKLLRLRGYRLYGLVERTQTTIAEIKAVLTRRGARLTGLPRRRGKPLPFKHNELPRLCLNVLHAAEGPIHIREVVSLILTGKGLDPLDRTLADAAVHRARDSLLHLRRKGAVRMIGAMHFGGARWALVECGHHGLIHLG